MAVAGLSMMSSIRGNKPLKNKSYKKKVKEAYQTVEAKSNVKLKNASNEELQHIRQLVKEDIKIQNRKYLVVAIITLYLISPIIYEIAHLLASKH